MVLCDILRRISTKTLDLSPHMVLNLIWQAFFEANNSNIFLQSREISGENSKIGSQEPIHEKVVYLLKIYEFSSNDVWIFIHEY